MVRSLRRGRRLPAIADTLRRCRPALECRSATNAWTHEISEASPHRDREMSESIRPSMAARLFLPAALLALALAPHRAAALPASGGDAVRGFYATLLSTMKNGASLGESGRYAKLEPVVRKTFDLPLMTRLAVGPAWAGLSQAQRQQVTAAFGRYISATYADRFDTYSGEKLQVSDEEPVAAGVVVHSRIVKANGEPVSIDYLMRRNGEAWQISDVYLDGTISQLATQRSEFAAILQNKGIDGLIATLNRKAALLAANRLAPQS
jgi:phospholipid transport system substrate-binding protein